MTMLIIYLSGVVFFLSQALIYSRISGARLRGALAWPLLLLVAPQVWASYKAKIEHVKNGLAHDERITVQGFSLGNDESKFFWGIGQ